MSTNPLLQEPREGDVLVIGQGEAATRHTLSDYNPYYWLVDPPIEGEPLLKHGLAEGLVRRGAATLEKKQEPYRAAHQVIGLTVSTESGYIEVPRELIGKTVEVRERPEDSTSIKSEGTV